MKAVVIAATVKTDGANDRFTKGALLSMCTNAKGLKIKNENDKICGSVLDADVNNKGLLLSVDIYEPYKNKYITPSFKVLDFEIIDNVRILKDVDLIEAQITETPHDKNLTPIKEVTV